MLTAKFKVLVNPNQKFNSIYHNIENVTMSRKLDKLSKFDTIHEYVHYVCILIINKGVFGGTLYKWFPSSIIVQIVNNFLAFD